MAVTTNGKKIQNLVKMGHVGSRDTLFGILGPPNISGTNKARNFKFGTYMDGGEC